MKINPINNQIVANKALFDKIIERASQPEATSDPTKVQDLIADCTAKKTRSHKPEDTLNPLLLELLLPSFKRPKGQKGEAALCMEIATWLQERSITDPSFPWVWFHVPNQYAGSYKGVFGSLMAWMGRISGAPDYVFMSKDICFFVEVKTQKGFLSKKQKMFKDWCESKDVKFYLCRSLKDVKSILLKHRA